jgi:hypothetical protein
MSSTANNSLGSVTWVESTLIRIVECAMFSDTSQIADAPAADAAKRANLNLARLAVMDLAKVKGYIVERKLSARIAPSLATMTRDQLRTHLATMMDELEPGARAEMRRLLASQAGGSTVIDGSQTATTSHVRSPNKGESKA